MEHKWGNVTELCDKLTSQLELRHAGSVTKLLVELEGDTLTLSGEVASEDCKGDAKRLLLGFDGVFKVRNKLIVAGYLEAASDDADDYFSRTEMPPAQELSNDILSTPQSSLNPNLTESQGQRLETISPRQVLERSQKFELVESPSSVEVMRHPKIDLQGELSPGQEVRIEIDLTEASLQGHPAFSLGSFSNDWETITIRVQLFAPWAIKVILEKELVEIAADGTSSPACFRLVVSNEYVVGTTAQLHTSFLHGTRVCGHVSRDLAPPIYRVTKNAEIGEEISPVIAIAAEASGPSLSITIICNSDGSQTWMWTALVPGRIQEASSQINLAKGESEFAKNLLEACPDLSPTVFRRAMTGIGQRLWEAAPEHFRATYLELRSKLGNNFSIQFISDDPHIPWEMMKPDINDIDHLFLEHPIARWPLNNAKPRRHQFPGGALLSFVPNYAAEVSALPSAKTEGEWLCANLGGVACKATSDRFLDVLDGKYKDPVGILHFAGHGSVDTGTFDGGIEMEDRPVRIMEVNQSNVVLGLKNGTLVVLNACETSAGSKLLGMNTGWGATIAARDFGGLVAPLWEVQDDIALVIIQEALPSLIEGTASLGEALLKARKRMSDTSISAFAYLAHGDVMAKFVKL